MFFSSVFVPKVSVPAWRRTDTLASARSEPSSMFTSLTPSSAQRRAQQGQPLARLGGAAQVGLGDDLGERGAAAVEVHDRGVGGVDAPAGADVDVLLGRVLREAHAVDAHVGEVAAVAQGLVVLGDLVALGQIGIEVVAGGRSSCGASSERSARPIFSAK